jgi:hypothetical protein
MMKGFPGSCDPREIIGNLDEKAKRIKECILMRDNKKVFCRAIFYCDKIDGE